jgi:hypothetical protein
MLRTQLQLALAVEGFHPQSITSAWLQRQNNPELSINPKVFINLRAYVFI